MTDFKVIFPVVATSTILVAQPTMGMIVQAPPSAVYIEVRVDGAAPAVFQSTHILYEGAYVSDNYKSYFHINTSLGSGLNTLTLVYYTVLPSDTVDNKLAARSSSISFTAQLDQVSSTFLTAYPPSGFRISQRALDVRVTWEPVLNADLVGYNFYMSTASGGPYYRLNTSPVVAFDPEATSPRNLFIIPLSAIPASFQASIQDSSTKFYATVASVLNSPTGGLIESAMSLEFDVQFHAFPSDYSSPVNRNEAEIKNGLLSAIHSYDMTMDIKPGSILQDIYVNPVSTEFAKAYQRLSFYHHATSVPTLLKFEDENGDGIQDTLTESPLRQQLLLAFNLGSALDVQSWIDIAFDRLASKFIDKRRSSTYAAGTVTFYTTSTPYQTIVIPQGTSVSSTLLGASTATFLTQETATIPLSSLGAYFNVSKSRWEVKVAVKASTAGSNGNALAGTVTDMTSGFLGNLKVTNETNLSGGSDLETNLELAARLRNAYLSKDSGRKEGIKSWISSIPGIYSCRVVGAGDAYMMRDYDPVRQRHVYGRADIYVDSNAVAERSQTMVITPVEVSTATMTVLTSTGSDVTLVSATQDAWTFSIRNPSFQVKYPPAAIRITNLTLTPVDAQVYDVVSWTATDMLDGSLTLVVGALASYPTPLVADYYMIELEVPSMQTTATGTTTTLISNADTWTIRVNDARLSNYTYVYKLGFIINRTQGVIYDISSWSSQNLKPGSVEISIPGSTLLAKPLSTDFLDIQMYILYSSDFTFANQPVLYLNSIIGTGVTKGGSGTLSVQDAKIVSNQDPLGLGNSTRDTKSLAITPQVITQVEPIPFVIPDPQHPSAPLDMTRTTILSGVVPFHVYTPVLVDNYDPTSNLLLGTHYTLDITKEQKVRVTRLDTLSASGSYSLTYQTYSIFPRKLKAVGEPVVLTGTTVPAYLANLGVDISAGIRVTSDMMGTNELIRGTDFRLTPTDDPITSSSSTSPYSNDYWAATSNTILTISQNSSYTTRVGLLNLNLSKIPDGSTVYISYDYYENISVLYSVDQGVIDAQNYTETMRSITSNLLVKRCNHIPVSIELSIALSTTADATTVENKVRSGLSTLFDGLEVGQGVPESEIIRIVKSVPGVANLTVPLTRLSYSDGGQILQETLPAWITSTTLLSTAPSSTIYESVTKPVYPSVAGGGNAWDYVAVYEDGLPLTRFMDEDLFLESSPGAHGTFYLKLDTDYRLITYIKPNRTSDSNADINTHAHSITYYVYGDVSTHDLPGADLSILTLDKLSLTFTGA